MTRLILVTATLAATLALVAAAAFSGAHPARASNCGINCSGGGPDCTWYGTLPAQTSLTPCGQNVWAHADLSTTGCCQGGSSFTYFWNGPADIRYQNVSGLRIYAAHPSTVEGFTIQNNSGASVWYWVHLQ